MIIPFPTEAAMSPLTPEEARQALADIDAVSQQMRLSVRGDGLVSSILMLWGVLWVLIFTSAYLFSPHGDRFAWPLNGLGILLTVHLVARREKQVRSEAGSRLLRQIAVFWVAVIAYAFLLPFLLGVTSWPTRLALMLSQVMLGYVLQGIWMKDKLFVILGLFITVSVVACHAWLNPPHFLLGLGLLGGGGLFAGGLVVRLGWR